MGLAQQKFIFSRFWKPEVQYQGVSSVGFSLSLSPRHIDAVFFLCPPVAFSLRKSIPHISSFLKRTAVRLDLGPTLMTSFYLNDCLPMQSPWRLGVQHGNLGEMAIQPIIIHTMLPPRSTQF